MHIATTANDGNAVSMMQQHATANMELETAMPDQNIIPIATASMTQDLTNFANASNASMANMDKASATACVEQTVTNTSTAYANEVQKQQASGDSLENRGYGRRSFNP